MNKKIVAAVSHHDREDYGGLGAVAAEAGISRESLYRTLSPKGNPTLKTLLAVLKAVGMRLSDEPGH
jgi:probable addiction module antidote protein